MERYIQISLLNDFVFCPKSIYLHNLYGKYNQLLYHQLPQQRGLIAHKNIDFQKYSSRKNILQGLDVYSVNLKICGKIDIFDLESGVLVERKFKIKEIYQGYVYQLYAQYFCLIELGYNVKKLFFHSLSDNKRYKIDIPDKVDALKFKKYLNNVHNYVMTTGFEQNPIKCKNCIYNNLCDSFNP